MLHRLKWALNRKRNLIKANHYIGKHNHLMPSQFSVVRTIKVLKDNNINLVPITLDDDEVSAFAKFAEYEFYYPTYYASRDLVKLKKIREHFVAAQLIELNNEDTYIDIASQHSPAPAIYERLFGCQVFRQDYNYPKGKTGRLFGGTASEIAVEDGFFTKMAMHCSFEHFEGDEDIIFIKEAERVLAKNGKLAIVPLYLCDQYFICTQPSNWANNPASEWPVFDPMAMIYTHENSGNRHERYYDADQFINRIAKNTTMNLSLFSFGNSTHCQPGQLRFAALFTKK